MNSVTSFDSFFRVDFFAQKKGGGVKLLGSAFVDAKAGNNAASRKLVTLDSEIQKVVRRGDPVNDWEAEALGAVLEWRSERASGLKLVGPA